MQHYKPRENVQSAHWLDVSGMEESAVLCIIGKLGEFTFISQVASSLYRPLHICSTLFHPRIQSILFISLKKRFSH